MKQIFSGNRARAQRVRFNRIHQILFAFCGALLFFGEATAQEAAPDLMKAPPVILQSGDLSMRFQPSRAWTFDELRFKDQLLNNPGSFTGFVMNFGGALFLGTGHKEAGHEQVESLHFTVDGTARDATQGGTFKGRDIELTKESTLNATHLEIPLHLKSIIRLNDGTLECEQFLTPKEDVEINSAYAFMFPWTTQTTEWMAKTTDGEIREGDFVSTGKPWELTANVEWAAIYNPDYNAVAVTVFPPGSQVGAGVRHAYWNVKQYHKQYYQPVGKSTLEKDKTYHWQAKVLFIPAEAAQWKEAARNAVNNAADNQPTD